MTCIDICYSFHRTILPLVGFLLGQAEAKDLEDKLEAPHLDSWPVGLRMATDGQPLFR